MEKTYGYIRVSTSDQNESLEVQQEKILKYCAFKGLGKPEFLIDEDVSGGKPILERPAGSKLTGIKDSNIIAVKFDRLFRSVVDSLNMSELWKKDGNIIHVADEDGMALNTETANGWLVYTFKAMLGEFERRQVSERTKAVLQHKKSKLSKYSGVPFGFKEVKVGEKRNGDPIYDIEANGEMSIVKRIFELNKTIGYSGIAKILNEDGVKTKKDKKFYASTIKYILNNEIYQK